MPGVGTAAGGAIGAGVAGSYTFAMGQAWAGICARVAAGRFGAVDGALDNKAIHQAFMDEFTRRVKVRGSADTGDRERIG